VELGGKLGYMTPPIRGGTTPFGAGFGARLGVAASGFYAGASVVDYLGGSDIGITDHALLYGAELGYGFRLELPASGEFFVIRPQIGVGDAAISHTDPTQVDVVTSASGGSRGTTTTVNSVYVEPAITTMFCWGKTFFALNGGVLVLPGIRYGGADPTTWLAYGIDGQFGFRF
jgi:hypothetical protein